jgi:hypothetical protein
MFFNATPVTSDSVLSLGTQAGWIMVTAKLNCTCSETSYLRNKGYRLPPQHDCEYVGRRNVLVNHVYYEAERLPRIIGEHTHERAARLHEWARQEIEVRIADAFKRGLLVLLLAFVQLTT